MILFLHGKRCSSLTSKPTWKTHSMWARLGWAVGQQTPVLSSRLHEEGETSRHGAPLRALQCCCCMPAEQPAAIMGFDSGLLGGFCLLHYMMAPALLPPGLAAATLSQRAERHPELIGTIHPKDDKGVNECFCLPAALGLRRCCERDEEQLQHGWTSEELVLWG